MEYNKIKEEYEKKFIETSFSKIEDLDFRGVYIITDEESKEILYVGSAYSRNISERLAQYTTKSITGNTLAISIIEKKYEKDLQKMKDFIENTENKIKEFEQKLFEKNEIENFLKEIQSNLEGNIKCLSYLDSAKNEELKSIKDEIGNLLKLSKENNNEKIAEKNKEIITKIKENIVKGKDKIKEEFYRTEIDSVIEKIRKFKIKAIEHKDLEYELIEKCTPIYNNKGNKNSKK